MQSKKEENKLEFTVYGSHLGRDQNPIGYVRTTQRGKWLNKQYRRFCLYRDHVISAFLTKYPCSDFQTSMYRCGRPITLEGKGKVYCDITIYFKNDVRADCDNVLKGILDSLFAPDKYVVPRVQDYFYDPSCPRVEVTIRF